MKKALIVMSVLTSGCALNASVRYPWDKQQDHHESTPAKASPTPTPEPTATPAKLEFEISPLDEPEIRIAPKLGMNKPKLGKVAK